jgi:hypothetical protein
MVMRANIGKNKAVLWDMDTGYGITFDFRLPTFDLFFVGFSLTANTHVWGDTALINRAAQSA